MNRLLLFKDISKTLVPYKKRSYAAKEIKFGTSVKALMLEGINTVADVVSVTLGPKGRSVIIEQPFGNPKITKEGLTIAQSINLPNKFKNVGVKLIQDVAEKTNETAGDGTTTAILLARGLAKEGFDHLSRGANPFEIRKGILLAVDKTTENLRLLSKQIKTTEDIEKVAVLSANGDKEVGFLVARAINAVGREGVVNVKPGTTVEDQLETIDGMTLERGYMSPHFVNCPKGLKVEYKDALVLLCQKKIFTVEEILPALDICAMRKQPLVIITEDIDEDPLSLLILNKIRIGLPVVCIKAPGFGEYRKNTLIDLATATGGVLFEDDTNLIRIEDCMYESLGKVAEVTVTKNSTILIGGHGCKDEMAHRIDQLRSDIEFKTEEFDRLKLIERLVRLQSKVAILSIGGSSEVEINEKKERVNDALNATRAAIDEGIVTGGGSALARCSQNLADCEIANKDQQLGVEILQRVLSVPLVTIAQNAGHDGHVIAEKLHYYHVDYGYDVLTDSFVNMMANGIMDSLKVVRQTLVDSARIASLFTTAEAVICNTIQEKKPKRDLQRLKESITSAM